jgi:tRNA(Ile)-lysidine synthase
VSAAPLAAEAPPRRAACPVAPLDAASFDAAMDRLGPFERRPAIAVGVSGGADSLALALLLQAWVEARDGRLLALVVDHRLRPQSTTEAAKAAAWLAGLGIEARVLSRDGPAPATAVQAKARSVRYALLEAATAAAGMLHLAVAHHAQDQRETVALRRASGSGPRGLAGMAKVRELGQVRLIRPLLEIEPQRLRALLTARRQPWLEDPANADPRYWRARHRADGPAAGCAVQIATTDEARVAARRTIDRRTAALLALHARPSPLGFVSIDAVALVEAADDLLPQLIGRVIATVGGRIWPPSGVKLARAADWLRGGQGPCRSLGGGLIERSGCQVRFVREPRGVAAAGVVRSGGMAWDGRFRIDGARADCGLQVAMAGAGWRARLAGRWPWPASSRSTPPAKVVETLPLVGDAAGPAMLGPWPLAGARPALRVRFRPQVRLADAAFCQSSMALVVSPR